jgi:hypothetical protein
VNVTDHISKRRVNHLRSERANDADKLWMPAGGSPLNPGFGNGLNFMAVFEKTRRQRLPDHSRTNDPDSHFTAPL